MKSEQKTKRIPIIATKVRSYKYNQPKTAELMSNDRQPIKFSSWRGVERWGG